MDPSKTESRHATLALPLTPLNPHLEGAEQCPLCGRVVRDAQSDQPGCYASTRARATDVRDCNREAAHRMRDAIGTFDCALRGLISAARDVLAQETMGQGYQEARGLLQDAVIDAKAVRDRFRTSP